MDGYDWREKPLNTKRSSNMVELMWLKQPEQINKSFRKG
jgi:hypothetical protein